jgi:hypothetical protein
MPFRRSILLALLLLPGCEAAVPVTGGLAAANIGSVMVIGRTLPDAVVSAVAGRDCSAVRLDRGLEYCRPEEAPPPPVPYCTRSIGSVDCWRQPPLALPLQRGVADGRQGLTPVQEANRTRRWPGLW